MNIYDDLPFSNGDFPYLPHQLDHMKLWKTPGLNPYGIPINQLASRHMIKIIQRKPIKIL
jgi:hypothetical protein